jgi:GT2 family glycosyltransferase
MTGATRADTIAGNWRAWNNSTAAMPLGVVIVNFRGANDTIECLESLLRCPQPMNIVVVENGSGDDSAERLRDWAAGRLVHQPEFEAMAPFSSPPVAKPVRMAEIAAADVGAQAGVAASLTLIVSNQNLGFAGGNNLGLRHLLGDPRLQCFWLLNNDTVVAPDAPASLLIRMLATPHVGMCGTVVRHYWEPDRLQALNGSIYRPLTGAGKSICGDEPANVTYNPQDVADATDFVLGASLCVSRRFLADVGFMAEDYFLYYEEIDWSVRNRKLRDNQFAIAFAHGANVFHKAGRSIGSASAISGRSAFSDYWMTRSRLKFTWRHYRRLWPIHWLLCWVQIARRLWRRQRANAAAIAKAALGRPF